MVGDHLIEVREYVGLGYSPVVDYGAWRVAILNYHEELLPENITAMQRHDETDEVFVLLRGRCILFLGEGDDAAITQIHAVDMVPFKIYNVKRGAWHTHTLSRDAMVLIVENVDTTQANSPYCPLDDAQRQQLVALAQALMGSG